MDQLIIKLETAIYRATLAGCPELAQDMQAALTILTGGN